MLTIAPSSMALLEDRPRTSRHEVYDEEHQRDDEQDVRDLRGDGRDAGGAKHSSDQADDEKHQGVIQHCAQLQTAEKHAACRGDKVELKCTRAPVTDTPVPTR